MSRKRLHTDNTSRLQPWAGFGHPLRRRSPRRQCRINHRPPKLRRPTSLSTLRSRSSSTFSRATDRKHHQVTAVPSPHQHPKPQPPLHNNHPLPPPTLKDHGSPSANPPQLRTSLQRLSSHQSPNPCYRRTCPAERPLTRLGHATASAASGTPFTVMAICVPAANSGTTSGSACG